jgi:hypothetical protein
MNLNALSLIFHSRNYLGYLYDFRCIDFHDICVRIISVWVTVGRSPVADLGFSVGGWFGGRGGGCGRGYPPAGGPGAWPPGKFFANRRQKYAFSRPCSGSICLFHHFIV